MPDKLLEVSDLRVSFFLHEGTIVAVNGVSFTVERGRVLGLVGESGCGKSVTARAILNMVRPPGRILSGQIVYHGLPGGPIDLAALDPGSEEIRRIRWGEIAMIFQEPMTSLSPVHTIGNQMIEAIRLHLQLDKKRRPTTRRRVLRPRGAAAASAPARPLPPRTQRWDAPARHDRYGAVV